GLEGPVSIEIRDVRGRVVRSLLRASDAATARRLQWDGRDQQGKLVGAGVYFVQATSRSGVAIAKICRRN
ncbi:MAG TPA: FlgD immunoglobulin-like domain containing protein, partial [bacterium]|nr:FlgD immunoglobulin-like domain containing protein [bacterium]